LYDNNEATVFILYFLIKPDFNTCYRFDVEKLNEHFQKYPPEFIDEHLVKFYKNTGLFNVSAILVFFIYL